MPNAITIYHDDGQPSELRVDEACWRGLLAGLPEQIECITPSGDDGGSYPKSVYENVRLVRCDGDSEAVYFKADCPNRHCILGYAVLAGYVLPGEDDPTRLCDECEGEQTVGLAVEPVPMGKLWDMWLVLQEAAWKKATEGDVNEK